MLRLRSLSLACSLGLALAFTGGSLFISGCSKSKQSEAKKEEKRKSAPKRRAPTKPKPTNPWLDEVIAKAEVTVTYEGGEPIDCEWSDEQKRHLCPDQERWVYVGPEVRRVDRADAYCVWQHPVAEGVVTTRLKGLASQPLELRHAFAGRSYTVQEAAPVDVVVRVDGEERTKAQRLRKPGFEAIRIEKAAEGKPGDVEIEVSTSHPGVAHFCWQLEPRPEGWPEATPKTAEASAAKKNEPKAANGEEAPKAEEAKKPSQEVEGASAQAAPAGSLKPRPRRGPPAERIRVPANATLRPTIPMDKLRAKPQAREER